MEWDKRIKEDSIIFTPFAVDYAKEEVSKYINTKCYFCNDIIAYEGLANCNVGILAGFNYTGYHPYIPIGDTEGYKFCLPAVFVEEEKPRKEKYVPFETIHDLAEAHLHIGNIVNFICKDYPEVIHRAVVNEVNYEEVEIAYDKTEEKVIDITLGCTTYSFDTLCNDYKYLDKNEEWTAFGKRVKE